jgi:hypothetical protein
LEGGEAVDAPGAELDELEVPDGLKGASAAAERIGVKGLSNIASTISTLITRRMVRLGERHIWSKWSGAIIKGER